MTTAYLVYLTMEALFCILPWLAVCLWVVDSSPPNHLMTLLSVSKCGSLSP